MERKLIVWVLLMVAVNINAQSPGGVQGKELWFRSNTSTMTDYSGDSNQLKAWNTPRRKSIYTAPLDSTKYFCFNPSIYFPKDTSIIDVLLPYTSLRQTTTFGVYAPQNPGTYSEYPKILTSYRSAPPIHSVWGEDMATYLTFTHENTDTTTILLPTIDKLLSNQIVYHGYIPEYIVYQRILSPLERRKVESYLALKYGITLNGSYYASNDELMWDYSQNDFNHRITGIARDSINNFYQPLSTTSYEAAPGVGVNRYKNAYYGNSSMNQPSSDHLLVMGREYGSKMNDGEYAIWGDNDGTTMTHLEENDTIWHLLNRTWKLKTNTQKRNLESAYYTNFTISDNGDSYDIRQNTYNYSNYFYKEHLKDDDFYIEFYCPVDHGEFNVGVADYGYTSCCFGFKIMNNGDVDIIYAGTNGSGTVATGVNGHKVAVLRSGERLVMQVDGVGVATNSFGTMYNTGKYSSVIETVNGSSNSLLILRGMRMSGREDLGCQAFLNYELLNDSVNFKRYRAGRTFMIIDECGEGGFDDNHKSHLRYIPSTDFDIERHKLNFHNIFFDTDSSGVDAFTFGWSDGLEAKVTPHSTTCESGNALQNGSIDVNILVGSPAFEYQLYDLDFPVPMVSGSFVGMNMSISNLCSGDYRLFIRQKNGYNMVTSSLNPGETIQTEDVLSLPAYLSWTIADNLSLYNISFETNNGTYVFAVDGTTLTMSQVGVGSLTPYNLNVGDVISFALEQNRIYAYINGSPISYPVNVSSTSVIVRLTRGNSKIYNFSVSGNGNYTGLTDGLSMEQVMPLTFERYIHIGNGCDDEESFVSTTYGEANAKTFDPEFDEPDETQNIPPLSPLNPFSIRRKGDGLTYTAELNESGQAMLLVYSAGGALMQKYDFGSGNGIRTCDFTLPKTGVYIVKALTDNKEYTYKIGGHQ